MDAIPATRSFSRRPRWLPLVAFSLVMGPWTAHAQTSDCSVVRFQAGENSTEIHGTVPAEDRHAPADPLCYAVSVGSGQRAKVTVVSGRGIALSIPGQGDARDSFDFVARSGSYQLLVFALFPTAEAEPFRIRIPTLTSSSPFPRPRSTTT